EIPELKNAKKLSEKEIKNQEGTLILKKIDSTDYVILLDENGKDYTSLEFSKFIQKRLNSGAKTVVFLIGGAYGFSDEIYS
ncbi:MAG: 23S rRNA (pseudouridine(1915)-N(3))-methyltransferase RlmH, partial [Flavobacteriales bacterium]